MYKEAIRPAWVEVNLSNLDYNIKNIRDKVGENADIIGVIKADGYGHGSVEVAQVLRENGVKTFAVAALSEVIKLREHGVKEEIIMLGLTPDLYADTIIEYDITPVVCSAANAAAIAEAAQRSGKVVEGLVAVDTGMGRIGYLPDDPQSISDIQKMETLEGFKIKGLFSHFATADAADKTYARQQEQRYNAFHEKLVAAGVKLPMRTFANSAAIMEISSVHFDAVRPGIILYGCYPSAEVDKNQLSLKPVMSVKANIIHLKKVPQGTTISYGRKYAAPRESLIATLALGYADGFPRPYSLVGKVIVNGVFAPIAGNICMDQCMVDVTDVPDVKVGDEVIIMGSDGTNTILADDIGDATGTINYEIVCAFGQRLPKIYVR
ncbi:MAG: alanine racemase [Firmicutes bacterium]|jgi:alanine racemase|nr:alanine racemase [Bacillota bacterium]NBI62596.1 alanine racemase [Clostridiales bacterium]